MKEIAAELEEAARTDPRLRLVTRPYNSIEVDADRFCACLGSEFDGFWLLRFAREDDKTMGGNVIAALEGFGATPAKARLDLLSKLATQAVTRVSDVLARHHRGPPVVRRVFAAIAVPLMRSAVSRAWSPDRGAATGTTFGKWLGSLRTIEHSLDVLLGPEVENALSVMARRLSRPDGINTHWDPSMNRLNIRTSSGVRGRISPAFRSQIQNLREEVRSECDKVSSRLAHIQGEGEAPDTKRVYVREWTTQIRLLGTLWHIVFHEGEGVILPHLPKPPNLPTSRALVAAGEAIGLPLSKRTVDRIFDDWQ